MNDTPNPRLALAHFTAFRDHPPRRLDDEAVAQYHAIVTELEAAFGTDLSSFRIPDTEMRQQVVSVSRASYDGEPGQMIMSEKRYCDGQFMR